MIKRQRFPLNLQLFAEGDGEPTEKTELDLLKEIQQLKETMVSKEDYDKVVNEKNEIIAQVINGQNPNGEEDNRSVDDIRKVLFAEDTKLSNREYVENALALREKVLAEGGKDPFLPYGEKISPTIEDEQVVERVVKTLEEIVEIANGDDDVFNNEFIRRLEDVPLPKKKK